MRAQTVIFTVAGLATAALGQGNTACFSTFTSFLSAVPQPTNSDLSKFISSYVPANSVLLETNPCAVATAVPTSLSREASAYQAQVASFVNMQSAAISAIATGCGPDLVQPSIVSGAVALVTALGQDSCFASKAPSETASPKSSNTPNVAMPKPTGVMTGAAVAAGFLGAVVML
ncbi:hypothetical protein F5B20DRAFT_583592 [Whalleya microplaca]|nr:hypothetical protein F5B20DRAFT_583592 [Whalleya microplaca]